MCNLSDKEKHNINIIYDKYLQLVSRTQNLSEEEILYIQGIITKFKLIIEVINSENDI